MNPETLAKIQGWIREKKVVEVSATLPTQRSEPETQSVTQRAVCREEVLFGNNIELLKQVPDNTFTAVVTDPPYGLEFMGKEWDAPWKTDWQSGGGFSKPGIGDRKTEWPSFSSMSQFGGANPTCATCGGRARGAKKCSCETPDWKPIGKRRNEENEGLPDEMDGTSMARQMRMFQEWSEAWAVEVLRVLKPGGHLLSFGGTRTYHRMVSGIEDAGFQIRDKIDEYCELSGYLAWVHGQGFPKSLNIGKAMDKSAGADRPVVGYDASRARPNRTYDGGAIGNIGGTGKASDRTDNGATITAPATDEAKLWEGYGTALKPAHEPIAVFGKNSDPLNPDVPFKYEGKASTRERNYGCSDLFWLVDENGKTLAIPKEDYDRMAAENEARKHEEGFQKHRISQGNIWPTVKPLDLMRYLVRMVKMPGENLILDPFMGSGTTIVACILEGCGYVGIDMDDVAVRIAKARIDYARANGEAGYK